ncbi:MAG: radical SAM protein [Gammaproteobacteria bacterium]|nr:radical SAM protein [Gammaproteobacteria bacterium]NIR85755.1 radical SAM protein [Gammaproteobacteria bacterium]NIR90288.1 radical SAM protein [Gammaproteobacteria bacterium]NIU06889.1 radical SAM protein [Gammaproteobacteria bacterium]NIV53822.1 radical SAM protein [Gammaproteobacteria bacterium]
MTFEQAPAPEATERPPLPERDRRGTLRLLLQEGGPGFAQFALNNVCNARCGFCNFALDKLPRHDWKYVGRRGALDAVDILYRHGVRYLVLTGGEPMLHPNIAEITRRATDLGMKVMLVTNAGLLKPHRVRELAEAGLSSFIISVDAADAEAHEKNRGLPGVCKRIREANALIEELGLHSTASVTMSRLVDYDALPDFLRSLGFTAVTFSYPLSELRSNFLSFSDSELVSYSKEELMACFDKIKTLKKRITVVNPTASVEDMQRFLRGEPQRYPCLGGFQYFYLDWELDLWRCHNWDAPMCNIYEFDGSQRVRDGCTACMIDCYRDSSTMHHVGIAAHDAYQALARGQIGAAARAVVNRRTLGSLGAVLEQMPWLLRF